jgi:hypothetical protein
MSSFREDLKFGEKYQKRLLEIIEWEESEMSKGKFKPYDCWIVNSDKEKVYFEVKADRKTQSTGNIAIEFECSGEPSGITTTQADYWAYFIHGTKDYFLIPTDELRARIAAKKYTKEVNGGDGWRSRMYLFPGSEFECFRDNYENQNVSDI